MFYSNLIILLNESCFVLSFFMLLLYGGLYFSIQELHFCSGLQKYLDQLGFNTVGYGCTTCIGNSGDLDEEVAYAIFDDGEEKFSFFHLYPLASQAQASNRTAKLSAYVLHLQIW